MFKYCNMYKYFNVFLLDKIFYINLKLTIIRNKINMFKFYFLVILVFFVRCRM